MAGLLLEEHNGMIIRWTEECPYRYTRPVPPRHSNYLGSGSPDGPGQVVKFDGDNTIAAAAARIVHVLYSIIASGTTIDNAPANEQIEEALN